MSRSLSSKIVAANLALIVRGDLGAIGEYFTPDYVFHLTSEDMKLGHGSVRKEETRSIMIEPHQHPFSF